LGKGCLAALPLVNARHTKKSFICISDFACARFFSPKRKTKLFFHGLLLTSRAVKLRFGLGEVEFFLPHSSSASPSPLVSDGFLFCFAKCAARKRDVALAPQPTRARATARNSLISFD